MTTEFFARGASRLRRAYGVALALVCCLGLPAQAETARQAPQAPAEVMLSFAPVVKKAQPAVVNVYASRTEKRPRSALYDDPIFERFFGGGGRPGGSTSRSLGSGVLVDSSGLVVTNYHVIEGMTDVKIALADKREFDADIVLRDQRTDLAVLRLKGGANFPVMELGDSDALEVGDFVLAIGNPFGVGQTVTQGIVSALARTQAGISDSGFFIQTDAAINPGNSGGGLVDMRGRLVGINSAIFSQTGNSVGIGFAVPSNMVRVVIAAAKSGQRVRRPWLGASLQAVSREIADSLGLDRPSGALVAEVTDGGPADKAGVKRGDIIAAVDGQTIDDPESFGYRLSTKALGGETSLSLVRNGKPLNVKLALSPAAEIPARDPVKLKGPSPFSGATVINLSPAVIEEMSVHGVNDGVVIGDIEDGSTAAEVNFQKGDVILLINDVKIQTTRDLEKAVNGRHTYWKLTILRGGQVETTVLGG
ncbi:protease Do [Methylocella silvestris BL2]|uniref:Protease Do n=1 Tax=Methylocella silvestris (strain DSM 15510 / CIP 108128 / LMG 27833 / NCIMB 13906 / BL2) TaxID=395965 RepID=B8EIT7_METSB|nr:Do family serine endopeptidase [Methylocella silvestris]ACK51904.1 protease Do [Methylocella silvestris BL2]